MITSITYSVVRLTIRRDKEILGIGTGFLYRRNNQYYLVTAWHNLSGRHSLTLKPIHSQGGLPNNMIVDMPSVYHFPKNDRPAMITRRSIRFEFDNGTTTSYLVHQQSWPRVDVAVFPFNPADNIQHETLISTGTIEFLSPLSLTQDDGSRLDIIALSDDPMVPKFPAMFGTSDQIAHSIGDDLFLLGFPAGVMDYSVTPIWKRATIATDPSVGWNRQKQFLVDSASRKGMSGGPAIYYNKFGHLPVEPGSNISIGTPVRILHGVYVGRIGDSEFEAQVGVIWKKQVIDEIIDHRRMALSTELIEVGLDDIDRTIQEAWRPDLDPDLYLDEKPPLYSFTNHVVEKLDGRANPEIVAERLKKFAATKKG